MFDGLRSQRDGRVNASELQEHAAAKTEAGLQQPVLIQATNSLGDGVGIM